MKKLALFWIFTLSFCFSLQQNILACSCGGYPSVCDAYNSADAVFVGTVTKVINAKMKSSWVTTLPNGKEKRDIVEGWKHHIKVEKTYKGNPQSEIVLAAEDNSCSGKFEVGAKLLLYAYFDKEENTWGIGYCGRNSGIEGAQEDLLFLDGLPNTLNRTLISGELSRYEDTPEKGFERTQTFANSKLTISSKTKTYNLTTDQNGVYQIYDLPIDTYKITPEIPNGLKIRFPIYYGFGGFLENILNESNSVMVDLKENRCVGASFLFNTNNKISGKVFDANGNPMKDVCLELVPMVKNPSSYFRVFDCTEEDGRYVLDAMPSGKYQIVANGDGKISSSEPFPPLYYPNTFDKEKAMIITMGEGDFKENYDITIPSQSEIITVQGKLLFLDGKPVVDEFVEFASDIEAKGIERKSNAKTDSQGNFSVNVLKGQKGKIFGGMYVYGQYKNCPTIEGFSKNGKLKFDSFTIATPRIEINATKNVQNIVLTFPFLSCQKSR
jgi:hypothetical protein